MEMGHGDEIVIGDGNFPAASKAQRLIRVDGIDGCKILEAILTLFPLDIDFGPALGVMCTQAKEIPPIWNQYQEIVLQYESSAELVEIERYEFYKRAQKAYAIIATSEQALYANLILRKDVVKDN